MITGERREAAGQPLSLSLMITLAAGAGLGITGMTLIGPSLPALQLHFVLTQQGTALSQAAYLLALAVPQLFVGFLSDRFGRRRPLLVGLSLFILGSIVCFVAQTLALFLAGRLLQAIGASAGLVSAGALLRERHSERRAAGVIGYLSLGMMVLPMLAPIIGGLVQTTLGWRANFLILAGLGLVVLFSAAQKVERSSPTPPQTPTSSFKSLLLSAKFRLYAGQIALASAANHTFLNSAPYLLTARFGLTPAQYGPLFSVPAISFLLANLISTRIVARWGLQRLILIGTTITLVGGAGGLLLAMVSSFSYLMLFAIASTMSFGHGLTIPNAMTGAIGAVPGALGRAAGLAGCLQMSLGALAVLIFMPLVYIDMLPLLFALAAVGGIAATWWFLAADAE